MQRTKNGWWKAKAEKGGQKAEGSAALLMVKNSILIFGKKNRARLGDAKVDSLKAKNKDLQSKEKKAICTDDFIKKYPKSITAGKTIQQVKDS